MSMIGTVRSGGVNGRGEESLFVIWEFPAQNDPTMIVRTWRVLSVRSTAHRWPVHGDLVSYNNLGSWSGRGYELWTEDEAKLTERPIPPPPKKETRGRPVRYQDGKWEIKTARGWR